MANIKSRLGKNNYKRSVRETEQKSNLVSEMARAFLVGGLICVLGQGICDLALMIPLTEDMASLFRTTALIFLGALLTGVGVYDVIGGWAGAGSIVPITGFANSIVSPAMEFRTEGIVMGVGAKMFTIAGPVLVYGILASVIYGFIYWLIGVAT